MSISQDRLRYLLTYEKETGMFTWNIKSRNGLLKPGTIAGGKDACGYRKIHIDGVSYKAHRLAWMYEYGVWPCGTIDHINGIPDDNRIANLREATPLQNQHNKRRPPAHNTSGYLGVSFNKQKLKWRATISIGNKSKTIGNFDSPEEASEAYLKAKRLLHEFNTL